MWQEEEECVAVDKILVQRSESSGAYGVSSMKNALGLDDPNHLAAGQLALSQR